MHIPPAFHDDDAHRVRDTIRATRLAQIITATADGPLATPLPLLFDETEGEHGTLYGHVSRANPQAHTAPIGDALALFMGPDAYVSPSWYPTKRDTEKVVPTWNYIAVQAFGPLEVFDDPARLLALVTRLTDRHEAGRPTPWSVGDAPPDFIQAQLRGIVGLRLPIRRLEGKRKLSQNRNAADRAGVAAGLAASPNDNDRAVAPLIPL